MSAIAELPIRGAPKGTASPVLGRPFFLPALSLLNDETDRAIAINTFHAGVILD